MTSNDPVHERQRSKNYAVLLGLAGFCALVFAVTILRMMH